MVSIKNEKEIELMRVAGSITAGALDEISKYIKPGISTLELDKIAEKFIINKGAKPAFLRYEGFPNSICASIDANNGIYNTLKSAGHTFVAGVNTAISYVEKGAKYVWDKITFWD